ncbi:MAG: ABC transporter permease [Pseudomonadota bacterium]|nr:ABC transporter permease [Pseudomonadota bacterium]
MSRDGAALAWFRAWGRAVLFAFAAAAAALSFSAYTARTRALAVRQVYHGAWPVQMTGELDELRTSNIDPYEREFVPRIAAAAISIFALSIVSCTVVMVIAYIARRGQMI